MAEKPEIAKKPEMAEKPEVAEKPEMAEKSEMAKKPEMPKLDYHGMAKCNKRMRLVVNSRRREVSCVQGINAANRH